MEGREAMNTIIKKINRRLRAGFIAMTIILGLFWHVRTWLAHAILWVVFIYVVAIWTAFYLAQSDAEFSIEPLWHAR